MKDSVKGLWNIVLSGYPKSGKTMLAQRLVAENPNFTRVGVDELRNMLFNEVPPCRDEFLVYSMIAYIRDNLLGKAYSVVIDSTAPDNITRSFLLSTRIRKVNRMLVLFNVERAVIVERNIMLFGNASAVVAWDKRWEPPVGSVPIFKFRSNNVEEFEACYARLRELLKSETHPFRPEFYRIPIPIKEIRNALKIFLKKRSK